MNEVYIEVLLNLFIHFQFNTACKSRQNGGNAKRMGVCDYVVKVVEIPEESNANQGKQTKLEQGDLTCGVGEGSGRAL
jgi:hypothetical protein